MKIKFTYLFIVLALLVSVHPAAAQNTTFTYQGRVLDNGTNFSGTGQFKFVLVTSTNLNLTATATATLSGGFITLYTVNSGGIGYLVAPPVTIFGGGGAGATAHATISGGIVTAVIADNPGSGYTSAPGVLIAPPPPELSYATYWSNDGTSSAGSQPAAAVNVPVTGGLFTVVLGNNTVPNMNVLDASLFLEPNLQLRIWFNDGVNGFAVLDPAQTLTTAPYAAVAEKLAGGFTVQNNTNGAPNIIGGSPLNYVASGVEGATISGGGTANYFGSIYSNGVTSFFGTVSGGENNTVSGGVAPFGTVSGGANNTASDGAASIGGGFDNTASGDGSTVGGGEANTASGNWATVPGGFGNTASGFESFAAGTDANAINDFSFVWSDATIFSSTADNQFAVHAYGGVLLDADIQIGSDSANYHYLRLGGGNAWGYLYGSFNGLGDGIHLGYNYYYDAGGAGHVLNSGGGTSRLSAGYGDIQLATGGVNSAPVVRLDISTTAVSVENASFSGPPSDRNVKQDFAPVSPSQILEKVLQLPVSEWSYKFETTKRHVGPMAQDFYATFNIGTDDKHIAPIDEGGVALAAIQALNEKVEVRSQNAEVSIRKLEAENDELKQSVAELKAMVKQLVAQK